MKLHQLRDVIAVADFGSLRSAARQLNIAQSSITKSLQLLEVELEVQLFERRKQGVTLTAMGTLFLERARAALAELQHAREDIRQRGGDGSGLVTMSLSAVPNLALLPVVIRPFMQRYPKVRLVLHEALGFESAEPLMRSGATDAYIGVRPGSKLPTEYVVEPLFRNERYVIARTGHPLANARSLGQLSDERWLLSVAPAAESTLLSLFRKNRFKAPERLACSGSIASQATLLLNSDMLMVGPKQLLDMKHHAGRLVRVPVVEAIEAPMIVMVRRAASPLTPAAEAFCDLVRRASARIKQRVR